MTGLQDVWHLFSAVTSFNNLFLKTLCYLWASENSVLMGNIWASQHKKNRKFRLQRQIRVKFENFVIADEMDSSPLAYTTLHQSMFRYMNIFVYQAESKVWTTIHDLFLFIIKAVFLYFGCVLQFFSLFTFKSVIELSTILFVGTVWFNISVKNTIFTVRKREIIKLWHQLDDDDFTAKNNNERRYVLNPPHTIFNQI